MIKNKADNDVNRASPNITADIYCRLTRDGVYVDFKRGATQKFQLPPIQIGSNYKDMPFPSPMKEELWSLHQQVIDSGEMQIYEHQLPTLDGSTGLVETRILKSGPDEAILVCRDITGQKNAEKELRESELRRLSIFDTVVDGIIIINNRGIIEECNVAAEQLFGYQHKALIGKNVSMLMPSPDQKKHDQYIADYMQTGHARIIGIGREVVGKKNDGTQFPMYLSIGEMQLGAERLFTGIVHDLTKSKQNENALRQSEEKYHRLFEGEKDAIIVIDVVTGHIEEVNRSALELFGYDKLAMTALNLVQLMAEPDLSLESFQKISSDEIPGSIIACNIQKNDGKKIPVEISAGYFILGDKNKIILSVRDVSDRHYSQAIRQSLDTMNEAQRIARLGSWEHDLRTDLGIWSDEMYRIFEMEKTTIPSYALFLQRVHPEDRARVHQTYYDLMELRQPFSMSHRLVMPDGRIKWVLEQLQAFFDENGKPVVSKGTLQDITERKIIENERSKRRQELQELNAELEVALKYTKKQTEIARNAQNNLEESLERLNEAQKIAGVGSWEFDYETNITRWSEQMYHLHGIDPADGLPDFETNLSSYSEDSKEQLRSAIAQTFASGTGFELELTQPGQDGEPERWIKSICVVIRDDNGKLKSLKGTVQDITWQKILELELKNHRDTLQNRVFERTRELELAKNEAEEANKAKSQFLSNMSHELRTPMNAILGFAQMLEIMVKMDERQKDYVQEILKGGYHLLDLIDEVLDLAKIESGKMDVSLEKVNIGDLIKECFALMQPLAIKKSIHLSHGELGDICVHADCTRLRQVLLNIISNALKYNSEYGTVYVELTLLEDNRLSVAVTDSGWGISVENIDKIFEPFYRVYVEHALVEGTGIGLAITKKLVELMGGAIFVKSQLGMGSCFWLELPLAENDVAQLDAPLDKTVKKLEMYSAVRKRVLYIEDNPANLKLVGRILDNEAHIELITAHEAILGLELIILHKPELILLDINMPHMDGYKVISILQQDEQLNKIPVIAITANAMPRDIERGKSAGFKEYLTKPLDVKLFLEKVNFYLQDIQ